MDLRVLLDRKVLLVNRDHRGLKVLKVLRELKV
jgi:hypothetical protein